LGPKCVQDFHTACKINAKLVTTEGIIDSRIACSGRQKWWHYTQYIITTKGSHVSCPAVCSVHSLVNISFPARMLYYFHFKNILPFLAHIASLIMLSRPDYIWSVNHNNITCIFIHSVLIWAVSCVKYFISHSTWVSQNSHNTLRLDKVVPVNITNIV